MFSIFKIIVNIYLNYLLQSQSFFKCLKSHCAFKHSAPLNVVQLENLLGKQGRPYKCGPAKTIIKIIIIENINGYGALQCYVR